MEENEKIERMLSARSRFFDMTERLRSIQKRIGSSLFTTESDMEELQHAEEDMDLRLGIMTDALLKLEFIQPDYENAEKLGMEMTSGSQIRRNLVYKGFCDDEMPQRVLFIINVLFMRKWQKNGPAFSPAWKEFKKHYENAVDEMLNKGEIYDQLITLKEIANER